MMKIFIGRMIANLAAGPGAREPLRVVESVVPAGTDCGCRPLPGGERPLPRSLESVPTALAG